jgi:hypothetical protein
MTYRLPHSTARFGGKLAGNRGAILQTTVKVSDDVQMKPRRRRHLCGAPSWKRPRGVCIQAAGEGTDSVGMRTLARGTERSRRCGPPLPHSGARNGLCVYLCLPGRVELGLRRVLNCGPRRGWQEIADADACSRHTAQAASATRPL